MAELARRTKTNPSTFAKFRNDPDNKAMLEDATIARIEEATGIKAYEHSVSGKPRGLAEQESSRYDAEPMQTIDGAVQALKAGRNGVEPWILRSRCLEHVGYLPGDVMMVDLNARPDVGDVVCALVYDRTGRAETVFRIFEDPFLVAATMDPNLMKPLLIDNDRVIVSGVVVASFRERRAA
ncbi:hypothetical protein CN154_15205 [Sinorhizobium meliloti]|uniref:hypothetical protein n=1 Tax=Rhizobium meliloti TaxID=382 RepID=UPI000FDB1817|nr:hypothetical protein [Sinorhizobium meliloti]RVK75449.1 hypothetical protein CN154_15205 [Sinorhizobium meliloti]